MDFKVFKSVDLHSHKDKYTSKYIFSGKYTEKRNWTQVSPVCNNSANRNTLTPVKHTAEVAASLPAAGGSGSSLYPTFV